MDKETKIKEFLAVLDMSAIEQQKWCWENIHRCNIDKRADSLVDLAFRLRNEAVDKTNYWWPAKLLIYQHHWLKSQNLMEDLELQYKRCDSYFVNIAQPIHWIIAAMIAKVLETDMQKA